MQAKLRFEFPWKDITRAWPQLTGNIAEPLAGGLINHTLRMSSRPGSAAGDQLPRQHVLQWLNPVFPPCVNNDVDAVTRHLASRGFSTFSLVPTVDGTPFLLHSTGSFRLLTYLEGDFLEPCDIGEAGATLARFHAAMADCTHEFAHHRNVHRPLFYRQRLETALGSHKAHRLHPEVRPLAEQVLQLLVPSCNWDELPRRIVHGDPKLENFWRTSGQVTLLDLDTVGRHCILGELGDAGRALCRVEGRFSLALFESFFQSYFGEGLTLEPLEIRAIPGSIHLIACELAARFLLDALEESYFGWDSSAFVTRGDHNLHRARTELAFAMSVLPELDTCLKRLS